MGLHCRACGLVLQIRSVPPTYCPRCLAKRRGAVKLVAAPTGAPSDQGTLGDGDPARGPHPTPSPKPTTAPLPHRDPSDPLAAALALARAETAMDLAALGEIRDGHEIVHCLAGEAASFGLEIGAWLPIKDTYCERLLNGRISNIVPDTHADQHLSHLAITRQARIGAYIGVALTSRDARLYVLCCVAHEQRPRLGERDLWFMRGLAATISAALHTAAGDRAEGDIAQQYPISPAALTGPEANRNTAAHKHREAHE